MDNPGPRVNDGSDNDQQHRFEIRHGKRRIVNASGWKAWGAESVILALAVAGLVWVAKVGLENGPDLMNVFKKN